ncbi:MAG: gamma-glutamyl-gamma-aminobutyrate hydrolase family protein [Terracidiphilus sp.]
MVRKVDWAADVPFRSSLFCDKTVSAMCVHIAIPEPTSCDASYNERSLPPYLAALRSAGATPILVPLHERQDRVARLLAGVQGILLPGCRFDVDPQRYGQERIAECGEPDPARTAVDELLLQEAFSLRKPILAICHGTQSLNVWLNGSLIQDLKTAVDHRPGREVVEAHSVRIAAGSRLSGLVPRGSEDEVQVNSSHHQAILVAGDGLEVSAVCPVDGVVEAVELDSPEHFVVGVQWHPERTYTQSAFSRGIFAAFVQAAAVWQPRRVEESVAPA